MKKSKKLQKSKNDNNNNETSVEHKHDTSPVVYQRTKLKYELSIFERELTEKQKEFLNIALNKDTKLIFVSGPAGSSKTYISIYSALKLLNHKGEFISAEDGQWILNHAENEQVDYSSIDHLGTLHSDNNFMQEHIDAIVNHPLVDKAAIEKRNFKIVIDPINSTGATFVPALLSALGVKQIELINDTVNGEFAHNPEPLPEHLFELCSTVEKHKADLGIAVDPDVDRLCFVNEDGSLFGEEYTLVAVADYILSIEKGSTVSNLSSTRALREVTIKHGGEYYASAVGEVNVVTKMKEVNAIIGGEGNGGVIFPDSHYGRDALMGIALFLSYYAQKGQKMSALKAALPQFEMAKSKIELEEGMNVDALLHQMYIKYKNVEQCNIIDGLKIDFADSWVHLRKSNTEPIIRIYSEANISAQAESLAARFIQELRIEAQGN